MSIFFEIFASVDC